jgi:YegS/Rv2252/BmrU family lipid kinase
MSAPAAADVRGPVRLIVNPAAGGGRAGRVAGAVLGALEGYGLSVRREDTRDLEHARALAAQAAAAGEIAVPLGGDGLVGAVADALRGVPGAILGVLPGGRGNDLARVLGIPLDPVQACAVIAHGIARRMDVGEIDGKTFVGIASVGFDSDANRIANEAPSRLGNLVYAYGALRAMWSWRAVRFEVELAPSGKRVSFSGYSVATANSRAFGGGMRLAPDALLDDGLLDVVLIEDVAKARYLWNLPKAFWGAHVRLANVRVLRAAEVRIAASRPFTMYADGDPIGELPVCVRALPGAVTVLAPPGAVGGAAFGATSGVTSGERRPPLPREPPASAEGAARPGSAGDTG